MSAEKAKDAPEVGVIENDLKPKPPPDGGAFAWLQVCGAFCLMFNSWGLVNTFGAFQSYYETSMLRNKTASEISWIGSLQIFLLLFGGIAAGPLLDKGYLRALILTGSFLIVFGMMMTSICHVYWQCMLAQGVVVGLGYACFMIPSLAVVPQYFIKRRALAVGVGVSGGSLGGVLYTIIFQRLIDNIGFGWTTRVLAFIALTTLLIPILGMRSRGNPKKPPMSLANIPWKDTPFMVYVVSCFFGFLGLYIPFFYVTVYAIATRTASANLIPYVLPIMNAGSLFGRLIPPFFADKTGALNMATICTLGAAITAFSWISVHTAAGLIVFTIFFGFFSGAFLALGGTIVAVLSPDPRMLGLRMAVLFVPASFGVLIGNPIAGALVKTSWSPLQIFCGAAMMLSALFLVASRTLKLGTNVLAKI